MKDEDVPRIIDHKIFKI